MFTFEIPAMSCGHCVRAITEAVHAVDPAAEVKTDLPAHQVEVHTRLPRDVIVEQLVEAGYEPA